MPTPPDGRHTRRDPNPVVEWVGYHLIELVGVTAPAVLAATVNEWCAVPAGLAAVWWSVHELRLHRRRRAVRRDLFLTAAPHRSAVEPTAESDSQEADQVTA